VPLSIFNGVTPDIKITQHHVHQLHLLSLSELLFLTCTTVFWPSPRRASVATNWASIPAMWLHLSFFKFLGVGWEWVHLVRRPIFGLLYQPQMMDDDECGVVSGMRIGRGNKSTRRKPAPVPLGPPQILHDLTWDRTWAAVVGSRQLTSWAMARPDYILVSSCLWWLT
jgi:hypothetical protein